MNILVILILSLVLAACAGDGSGNTSSNDVDGNANSDDENDTDAPLTATVGADVVSLSVQGSNDIPSGQVTEHIYETLVNLDENKEPAEGLAEDWEQVDERTWDFFLKKDISFHDGEKFDAEAVKSNFDRLMDKEIGSPRTFLLEPVDSWEVIDDYTIRIKTKDPFAPLLANLAHIGTGIMSPAMIEEDYQQMEEGEDPDSYINKQAIGTGPLQFESWTPGEKIELSRSDDYHGELAKSEKYVVKVVSEQSARIAELETGNSDVAESIGSSNVKRVEQTDGVDVVDVPSVSLDYIGLNTEKEPFDDVKVRQAISMVIDKESIIDGVYEGYSVKAEGPVAPTIFGHDESLKGSEYDVETAKQLMEEAGYADGFETTLWTDDDDGRKDIAVSVQSQLEELNIDIEIVELEWGTYLERVNNGEHDMFVLGWSTATEDADFTLYQLFHSSQHGSTGNRTFIDDDELDSLLDDARQETDIDKRKEIYSEAQELLVELAPMIYLGHSEHLAGVGENVKGFDIASDGTLGLPSAYKE